MSGILSTKVSSRGQVVIPRSIRRELDLKEGTPLVVFTDRDMIVLKAVQVPSREDLKKRLEEMFKWGEAHAKKLGIKESDVPKMIARVRGLKHG